MRTPTWKIVTLMTCLPVAAAAAFYSTGSSQLAANVTTEPGLAAARGPAAVPAAALTVTVQAVQPTNARPEVRSYGEAKARYRTVLRTEVSGALISVANQAHSGQRVRKGTILMQLDKARLVENLAQVEADLAQTRVRLAEENLRAQQAAADWQRIGDGEPASEFLLRNPQRRSAQLAVAAAEAARLEARNNLQRAVIRAPFDAVVVRRIASLGSYLQTGAELIELDSSESVEVRLALSPADWSLLPPATQLLEQGWPVDLTPGDDATPSWQGRVSRVEQHVVSASRQRSLVVTVPNPLDLEPPLFPGTFVRASLAGRELNGVLDLPVSAITEQQEIWFVDDQGRLARMPVEALMASDGRALVRPPAALDWANGLDVLVHPMASYLPGIAVDRQRIEDADR